MKGLSVVRSPEIFLVVRTLGEKWRFTVPEFYRTVFWIEVLSEGAYNPSTLSDIAYDIGEGDCVGAFGEEYRTQLSSEEMAEALTEMGSDPSFFGIEEKPVRDIGDWIREEEERNLD